MIKKYYVIKKGLKEGIFNSWDECKDYVVGYKGAIYKSFSNLEDAENYFNNINPINDENIVKAYIDGSYDINTGNYSFGCVLFINNEIKQFKKLYLSDEYSKHRNVAGEIKGAGFIINYLYKLNIKEFYLYYDYLGIEKWYNGSWKANSDIALRYREFSLNMKDKIKIHFVKIKSHSNDFYNDLADKLAKEALNI